MEREKIKNLTVVFLKLKLQISLIQTSGLIKTISDPDRFKLQDQSKELDDSFHSHVLTIRQTYKKCETMNKSKLTLPLLSSVVEKTIDSLETVLSNVKEYVKDLLYEKSAGHLLDEMLRYQITGDVYEESKFDPSTVYNLKIYNKTFELSTMLPTSKRRVDDFEKDYEVLLESSHHPLQVSAPSKICK
mmetsp:Transcript_41754/g.48227  ORF Transcript_41754/g.48227 Transcript_41754/m.48227 type:complete len:188 (-) Transcript_41754:835-1398(-)